MAKTLPLEKQAPKETPEKKRRPATNLYFSEELRSQLKMLAAARGIPMNTVILEAIHEALGEEPYNEWAKKNPKGRKDVALEKLDL